MDRAIHEGDNPSFWDEFMKFSFFLTVHFLLVLQHCNFRSVFNQPVNFRFR
jgi:hypothetical protein